MRPHSVMCIMCVVQDINFIKACFPTRVSVQRFRHRRDHKTSRLTISTTLTFVVHIKLGDAQQTRLARLVGCFSQALWKRMLSSSWGASDAFDDDDGELVACVETRARSDTTKVSLASVKF